MAGNISQQTKYFRILYPGEFYIHLGKTAYIVPFIGPHRFYVSINISLSSTETFVYLCFYDYLGSEHLQILEYSWYKVEKIYFKPLGVSSPPRPIFSPFFFLFQTSSWLCVSLLLESSVAQPKATISRFYFTKPKLNPQENLEGLWKRQKGKGNLKAESLGRSKQDRGTFLSPEKRLPLGGGEINKKRCGSLKARGQGGGQTPGSSDCPILDKWEQGQSCCKRPWGRARKDPHGPRWGPDNQSWWKRAKVKVCSFEGLSRADPPPNSPSSDHLPLHNYRVVILKDPHQLGDERNKGVKETQNPILPQSCLIPNFPQRFLIQVWDTSPFAFHSKLLQPISLITEQKW